MTPPPSPEVTAVAQRMLEHVLAAEPLQASLLGYRQHDADLADLSRAHEAALAAERAEIRATAMAIDPTGLSADDAITRSIVISLTEYGDDEQAAGALEYTVAAFPVSPSSVLLSYLRINVLTNGEEAEAYLQRLAEIPRYLAQASERLAEGRGAGLLPVAKLVGMAMDQIDVFLAAAQSPVALPAPEGWDGAEAWRERQAEVIDTVVKPAFAEYRDVLRSDVLPTARPEEEPGLVYLPGGRERYLRLVHAHTTTDRTPDELHQVGLDVVAGIHREFSALGEELFGIAEPVEIFRRLQEDPALRWENSAQILAAAEETVRRAEKVASGWFGRTPVAVCALEEIPEIEAEGSAPAYYMPPAVDGSRPGTYYTNASKPTERTRYDLESVAFHEAVPGHHFQIALALEMASLPEVRKISFFNAYVEGWGLYAERLADEMGLYSSPLQRMGMLSADAWRAARLVVDTGLHWLGWSRQQALDYVLENTPVAPIDASAEIDRYIAMPGQALGYMTGRLEIQALRSRAQQALGPAFDIRDFHDVVLGSGALPLGVLEEVVDSWIREQAA